MAVFPTSAIVGQDETKRALLIAAVDARVGGVMIFCGRGTGKSTAARALAATLPPIAVVAGCRLNCALDARGDCPDPLPLATFAQDERLRITPSPVHTDGDIDKLLCALGEIWSQCAPSQQAMAA